jgi:hypothetical protein
LETASGKVGFVNEMWDAFMELHENPKDNPPSAMERKPSLSPVSSPFPPIVNSLSVSLFLEWT